VSDQKPSGKYEALGRIFEQVLGVLANVLPALFVYLMNRSKSRADSLESKLELKETELQVEHDKDVIDAQNKGNSPIDIVDNFINDDPGK